ncbi:DUF5412 domain-containing protein [Bacillus suaedaesalsae]|uniref:DUF5412 domain-containing protein n=1 Tax=Bacillus suaedaesalsae TaxID=2810349 RepID=A0ABS2DHK2_9BACI|nr:DUF5412 domain-containing protein [Bacillus suaedaesalsae]MBM6617950.1 DUF5412 domain-containing protein [Bacillus suaedaesalsae]
MNNDIDKIKMDIRKKTRIVILAWVIGFTAVIGYGVNWLFFDMSRFKQDLIAESTSPNGNYTIYAYSSDGGATTSYSVLSELNFNKENKRSKKIYWQYREEDAKIVWKDENTVVINGIELNVPDESYDYRSGIKD